MPNQEAAETWAKANKLNQSYQELCRNANLRNEILQDMSKIGKSAGLHSFEQVCFELLVITTFLNGKLVPNVIY